MDGSKKRVETAKTAKASNPTYLLSALREHCTDALGVERSTFDGAFSGQPDDAQYTLDEAKARINKWLACPAPIAKKRG